MSILTKVFGDASTRKVKRMSDIVAKVNHFYNEFTALDDDHIREKMAAIRTEIQGGRSLDDALPEVFALVKLACKRLVGRTWDVRGEPQTWEMVPYDEQIIGGIALHEGNIAEMKTGEGKTLVATMPLVLNALAGKGAHLVTANEYLALRDAEWMGEIYKFLGLTVGSIMRDQPREEKQAAYRSDITYGTNNEFGFDYLRDNMVVDLEHRVQRDLAYAIVDEVDSILIDEARTPLIISAPAEESTQQYYEFSQIVQQLKENDDYNIDEKLRASTLTEEGITKLEKILRVENIYEERGIETVHHIEQALRAKSLFHRDRDYVVKDGEVIIVDQFTGRLMPGRRYSEGLHQALEAKEGLEVQRESKTHATITFQNYFRLYDKLAGMTGTAKTEEEEFQKIYNLDVVLIPTHRPVIREDYADYIYKNEKVKFQQTAMQIAELHKKGQPVLVGTISVEKSEALSAILQQMNVPHEVLNAKNHEREAKIVAKAGEKGAVTIATNMAGRGTDIKLGEGVRELGGLFVLGTERHESRRIDNQLRGRAGRQGDPGVSRFFVSLQDDLLRIFGSDRMGNVMDRLGIPDDQPIENGFITRTLENAQKKVEGNNFDIRKHVVEYDDVMNKHRETIYRKRTEVLQSWKHDKDQIDRTQKGEANEDEQKTFVWELRDKMLEMIEQEVEDIVTLHTMGEKENAWDLEEIVETMKTICVVPGDLHATLLDVRSKIGGDAAARTEIISKLVEIAKAQYVEHEKTLTPSVLRQVERAIYLRAIDSLWIDHLTAMDQLRDSVRLQGYSQKDPLVEYKREGFVFFRRLLADIQRTVVHSIYKVRVAAQPQSPMEDPRTRTNSSESGTAGAQPQKKTDEPGRNDLCFCGSGKKYKKCHGKK